MDLKGSFFAGLLFAYWISDESCKDEAQGIVEQLIAEDYGWA
jgi:hypothetical protein